MGVTHRVYKNKVSYDESQKCKKLMDFDGDEECLTKKKNKNMNK